MAGGHSLSKNPTLHNRSAKNDWKNWVDLDDLEKAYMMYLSCSKIFEALRKVGSKVMLYEEALRIYE